MTNATRAYATRTPTSAKLIPRRTKATPVMTVYSATRTRPCQSGVCTGGNALDCGYLDDQCNTGVCDEDDDQCEADPVPHEGNACDDGLFCNENETVSPVSVPAAMLWIAATSMTSATLVSVTRMAINAKRIRSRTKVMPVMTVYSATRTRPVSPVSAPAAMMSIAATSMTSATLVFVTKMTINAKADPVPHEGNSCDDGLFCTVDDACASGQCTGPGARLQQLR